MHIIKEPKKIQSSRLERFEAFRNSLSLADQQALDRKLQRWKETMNAGRVHGGFGLQCAQELLMALVEFKN